MLAALVVLLEMIESGDADVTADKEAETAMARIFESRVSISDWPSHSGNLNLTLHDNS